MALKHTTTATCDDCGVVKVLDSRGSFGPALTALKREGWSYRTQSGSVKIYCYICSTGSQQPLPGLAEVIPLFKREVRGL